jgi:LysM repeat protein
MVRRFAFLVVIVGTFLSGCGQATPQDTFTPPPTGLITPYQTSTPTKVIPTATIKVTMPVTPTLTPTPLIYTLKGDETMLEIAYQFGIDWRDLQAANPQVDPHYMGPGLQLIIPIAQKTPEVQPTPTPMAVKVKQTACYPTGDGGAWCIVTIQNNQKISIENLSAWIGLYNPGGKLMSSQVAYAPLNILQPGSIIPLMAYFNPPIPDQYQVQSEMLSGLAVADDESRYLDLKSKVNRVEISTDGLQAEVNGEVILPAEMAAPTRLWVLAVAYDSSGEIVGARKWKSDGEVNFEITVYSLVGAIDHVEVLVEARP